MSHFYHHPDGRISLHSGNKHYNATLEEFALDLGRSYDYSRHIIYEPGKKHRIDGVAQESLVWPEGDAVLADIDRLLAAQEARENPPPTLAEAKLMGVSTANYRAEEQRGKWITLLPGKIGEYRQKELEVERWVKLNKTPNPPAVQFPIANAESKEYNISIAQMLQVWEDRTNTWANASALIAAAERRVLIAVEAAQTVEQVKQALDNATWPAVIS